MLMLLEVQIFCPGWISPSKYIALFCLINYNMKEHQFLYAMSVVCVGLIKDDPEELLDNHAAIIPGQWLYKCLKKVRV